MDTIPYRNTSLITQTIPKGTLLFRLVENSEDDLRGVPIANEKRCITPHYHVYFYPNPFMGSLAIGDWLKSMKDVHIYKTTRDLKVLLLVSPSKYSRSHKTVRNSFIKRCDKVPKGCLPRKLDRYNPCLSNSLIEKHPDVVGVMSIARGDALRLQRNRRKATRKNLKYFHYATDAEGNVSPPELALHPLAKRSSKDVISTSSDKLENNYELLKTMSLSDEKKLRSFMNTHAEYDPETYFFKYKA